MGKHVKLKHHQWRRSSRLFLSPTITRKLAQLAHKGSPKEEVTEDAVPTKDPGPFIQVNSPDMSSAVVSQHESSPTKAQTKERLCTLLKSLSTNPLEFEDHACILEDILNLTSVEGNQFIKKFIVPFIENTRSLKERHDLADAVYSEFLESIIKIAKLKSKLESDTEKKEDIQRLEDDMNRKIPEINEAISKIEEEIARLEATKVSLEDERAAVEASRLSLPSAIRSIEADLQKTSTCKHQLVNMAKSQVPEYNAASMELNLIELEAKEIENKVLYFLKVIERL